MKNKGVRIAVSVIVSVVIFVAAFTIGFFVDRCAYSKRTASLNWALKLIEKNYYYGVEGDIQEAAIDGVVSTYLDRYSEYYTAEEYARLQADNAGSKSGVGISYSYLDGRGVYIANVVYNSPADDAKLKRGEIIAGGKFKGSLTSFDSAKRFSDFISAIEDGAEFTLVGEDGTEYAVKKENYNASYVKFCTNKSGWSFKDSLNGGLALYEEEEDKIPYLPDGAAYMALSQFFGSAAEEFEILVEKFNAENCTSLIIDLRSNGGGFVDVMSEIAGCFADGKRLTSMSAEYKSGKREYYECKKQPAKRQISKDVKVSVLANSGTASASEALIGAMINYGALGYEDVYISEYSESYINWQTKINGNVKNGRTYGKGIMQTTYENEVTHEAIKMTTAQIYWPDGVTCIHDRGLSSADRCKTVKAEWQHTKTDEELFSAVNMIFQN